MKSGGLKETVCLSVCPSVVLRKRNTPRPEVVRGTDGVGFEEEELVTDLGDDEELEDDGEDSLC